MPGLDAGSPIQRRLQHRIADILAKAAFGLVIFKIARFKSEADDPSFDEDHEMGDLVADRSSVRA